MHAFSSEVLISCSFRMTKYPKQFAKNLNSNISRENIRRNDERGVKRKLEILFWEEKIKNKILVKYLIKQKKNLFVQPIFPF